jgi:competence protein ComEC
VNRPLAWAALALVLGLLAAKGGTASATIAAGLALAALVASGFAARRAATHVARLAMMFFLSGLALAVFRWPDPPPAAMNLDPLMGAEALVLEAPIFYPELDFASLIIESGGTRLLLRWSNPDAVLYPGDRVLIISSERTPMATVNFGTSSYEDHLRVRGVTEAVSARGGQIALESRPAFAPGRWLVQAREFQAGLIRTLVPQSSQAFMLAVWLGDRTELTQPMNDAFVRAGTAHVLAVSGLHVGLVFVTLETTLLLFGMRERPRTWLVIVAVFAFALMAGARVSSLRAGVMIALYVSARLFRREPDAPTSLSIAAMLFLAINPALLGDAAFLLSFGAVASLLLFADPLQALLLRWRALPFAAAQGIATGLAVQVLTWPIAAAVFHVVPLASPLVNLLVVPMLGAVLWLGVLMTWIGALLPSFGVLFGYALHPFVQSIIGLSEWVASSPYLSADVTSPTAFALVCYYAAALLPFGAGVLARPSSRLLRPLAGDGMPRSWVWRVTGTMAVLLALSAVFWTPAPPRGVVDFLDIGHADATVVYAPEGGVVLIDGGDRNEYTDAGARVVLPALRAHGVSRIDAMVATHADRDHIGGLITVINSMRVTKLITTLHESGKPLEVELLAAAAARGTEVIRMGAGAEFAIGGARFEALHPAPAYRPPGSNDSSLVLRLSWTGDDGAPFSVMLPGDLEYDGERQVARLECAADVLKAGHHGSATSSSHMFLDAVQPAHAIVSTRKTGRLDAIGRAVQDRFDDAGVTVWRTDLLGGIRLEGPPLRLTTARQDRAWLAAD